MAEGLTGGRSDGMVSELMGEAAASCDVMHRASWRGDDRTGGLTVENHVDGGDVG